MAVVVAIVGVLSAVAVVAWGFVRSDGNTAVATATLDRVATVEQSLARNWGTYSSWPADITGLGPGITVVNQSPSTAPGQVSLAVGDAGSLGMAVTSGDGACTWRVLAPLDSGAGMSSPTVASGAACSGAAALPAGESPIDQSGSVRQDTY